MKSIATTLFVSLILTTEALFGQSPDSLKAPHQYWNISGSGICWDVGTETQLPHSDHIEMAGQRVAGIINYSVDKNKQLSLERDIIFPQLRTFIATGQSWWKKYRAYLRHSFTDELLPVITLNKFRLVPGPLDSVTIEGKLRFYHQPVHSIRIERTLFPSMRDRFFVEKWQLSNLSDTTRMLHIGSIQFQQQQMGHKGVYTISAHSDAPNEYALKAYETLSFAVYFEAGMEGEPLQKGSYPIAEAQRDQFLGEMRSNLIFHSPDKVINTLFYFSKIRAAENIFDSKMGLVHSPGGGNYYTGIWANDQAEYSGPFFPFLGYETGNTAAYNCYKHFLKTKPDDYSPITSSFEMEGDLTCCGADRGDAAMISFGASQFALLRGDPAIADELWPLIEWCLEYCHRRKNEQGVVQSDSDEMEGRIATGNANLATSSLYYGGLKFASHLANALGKNELAKVYKRRATELANAVEHFFGARIEGLDTYRYFAGNDHLRHWICLPLVMGMDGRKEGTIEALFDKLWTDHGVLVEYNPTAKEPVLFWDRGTLYALRGAFKAGATDQALHKLSQFSNKRLLGEHVPYVIEAWPENNMRHLSAESALYARILLEGLLGLEPTGFRSFSIHPRLAKGWDGYRLDNIHAFGHQFGVALSKEGEKIRVVVSSGKKQVVDRKVLPGQKVSIAFK